MKEKIALHIVMPNQVSGPNTANRRMASSFMKDTYDFCFITQTMHSGSLFNFKLLSELMRQIKAEKPALLHINGLNASGFYAVLAARLAGYRNILVTIRGTSRDALDFGGPKRFLLTKIMEPLTLSLCRGYMTVCTEMAERSYLKRYRKKFCGVLYNAAPEIVSDASFDRDAMRASLGLQKDDFAAVVVGRVVRDKGVDDILAAMELLKDEPRMRVVFAGDGNYEQKVIEAAKRDPRIIFLGKRSDMKDILRACDTFLFATLHENLSNALLEAMSVGLPVVATRIGGNVEVVEDGVNGYLIDAENAGEMAARLRELAADPEKCRVYSDESKRIIAEKFSQKIIYTQLMQLYGRLLADDGK